MKWRMEDEFDLQKEFGYNALCGYIRDPEYVNGRIRGLCALDGRRCSRDVPMEEEECRRKITYFATNE